MDSITIGFIGLAAVIFLLALRVPIAAVLGGVAFVGMWFVGSPRAAWGMLGEVPYVFTAHWTLSSIPMFLLMGYISYYSRITEGLFKLAHLWLGGMRGGLGIATISGAAGFSAVTGSSLAAAAAMGRIAVPEMMRSGYRPGFACGIVAAAGTIGSMIPPSIFMIVYGVFAEVSIGKLFIAGIVPGILTAAFYSAVVYLRATINPSLAPAVKVNASWSERIAALSEVWPFLLLVVGVFGGLFAGIFTPTEAGAVGAFLSMLLAIVRRTLTWKILRDALVETVLSTASIFLIAIGAALLTRFLAMAGVPEYLSVFVSGMELSPLMIIMVLALIYLVLGMFLDPLGCMLLTLPIVLPILEAQNSNLIWFGILMVKLLEIGLITPPVGLNIFVIKDIVGDRVTLAQMFAGVGWFIVSDVILLVFLVVFPALVLFLPNMIN